MANRKDTTFKIVTGFHRSVFRASKGKLLGRGSGMPMLVLTTTGRKSGQARPTMLSTPMQIGESIVIVASKGGDDRDPVWYLNLVANPAVNVEMSGTSKAMTARVAEGTEREELWSKLTVDHANYAGYQTKTDRVIPVIVLDPVTA